MFIIYNISFQNGKHIIIPSSYAILPVTRDHFFHIDRLANIPSSSVAGDSGFDRLVPFCNKNYQILFNKFTIYHEF